MELLWLPLYERYPLFLIITIIGLCAVTFFGCVTPFASIVDLSQECEVNTLSFLNPSDFRVTKQMLWRILSTVGLYLSIPYDSAATPRHEPTEPPNDLDPIEVAGRCRKDVVSKFAKELDLDFAVEAIHWTESIEDILQGPTTNMNKFTPTSTRYKKHFADLQRWGILERLTGTGPLKYISKYFSIAKTELVDRAIFNGRRLSKLCHSAPPVNIPSVPEIVVLLSEIMRQGGKLEIYVADIRHWFHQIRVGKKVWQYFGVCMQDDAGETQFFGWRTLPMGFGYSPRICQCIAWTLLLYRKNTGHPNIDGLQKAREQLRHAKHPPRFVHVCDDNGKIIGVVTLTYDNILVAVSDPVIWKLLVDQIEYNLEVSARVVMKEKKRFSFSDLVTAFATPGKASPEPVSVDRRAVHLGIEYAVNSDSILTWRHDPGRLGKWLDIYSKLSQSISIWTPREIARACGIVVWHLTVSLEPLCEAVNLIRILRRIATDPRPLDVDQPLVEELEDTDKSEKWDTECPLLEHERLYLLEQMKVTLLNPWMTYQQRLYHHESVLFTDASKRFMGAVVSDRQGNVNDIYMGQFPTGVINSDIYIKELVAAVLYTQLLIRKKHLRNCKIYILIDNSAAFFALSNWYSSSEIACKWLSRLFRDLEKVECSIEPILIISEDNPADTPSRGTYDVCEIRMIRGMNAFRKHLVGIRHASKKASEYFDDEDVAVMRHHECTKGLPECTDDFMNEQIENLALCRKPLRKRERTETSVEQR